MSFKIASALQLLGLAAVTTAAALVSVPLGVFVAGVALLLIGVAVERG